jgi:hypothetical protein
MTPMNSTTLKSRLVRASATLMAAGLLSAPVAALAPAQATAPQGSLAEVILETRDVTGQPAAASLRGWWGHEGGRQDAGLGTTYLSMDASDGHGVVDDKTVAALHRTLHDGGSFDNLRVAFVPYSADGSNERPRVHQGENAGEAFRWFADLGFGGALNGSKNANDFVNWVSTEDEYSAWWKAGRPVQAFTDQLKVLDVVDRARTRPATAPQGRSLLDRWPAGTKVSLVFYVSDGVDRQMPQVPTVKVGPDGRALTSWLTFETVASPTHPARTSAGYRVLTGAGTGPEAARPVKTGTGQEGAAPAGTPTSAPAGGGTSSPASSTSAGAKGGDSNGSAADRLVSYLPGGRPTFWVVLALLVVGAGGLTTMRLRWSSAADPGAGNGTADADHTVNVGSDRAPL